MDVRWFQKLHPSPPAPLPEGGERGGGAPWSERSSQGNIADLRNNTARGQAVLSDALPLDDRIDLACDRLEASWKSKQPITVDDLLKEFSTYEQPLALKELLAVEIERRKARGESLNKEEYFAKWPEHQSIVMEVFDETMEGWTRTLLLNPTKDASTSIVIQEPVKESHPRASIGKYAVVEALDKGGQATVYRAIHPELRRDVVIKFCHFDRRENARLAATMVDEGRVLASLDHPNLAKVFDFDFDRERPYLVMEFVDGLNLSQYRRQRNPTPAEWIVIARKIADALSYVHHQGVLHLDIKPQNILVDKDETPRLIDFGLSRNETAWNQTGPDSHILSGTIQYMSPEQAKCEVEKIGPKSDIFSLGGVLYYLATGCSPVDGANMRECFVKAENGDWDRARLANCEPRIRKIIERAMAKAPEDRFASASEMAAALKALETKPRRSRFSMSVTTAWFSLTLAVASLMLTPMLGLFKFNQLAHERSEVKGTDNAIPNSPTNKQLLAAKPPGPPTEFDIRTNGFALVDAAPLKSDDPIVVTSEVPAGLHVSLFVFDSDGRLTEVDSKPASSAAFTYRFPEDPSRSEKIVGSSGIDFVFFCGRRDRPVTIDDLKGLDAFASAWPALTDCAVIRVSSESVEFIQRARSFGGRVEIDPQQRLYEELDRLRRKLVEQGTSLDGLAFPHGE